MLFGAGHATRPECVVAVDGDSVLPACYLLGGVCEFQLPDSPEGKGREEMAFPCEIISSVASHG
jgi:hypothetical protein